MPPTMRDSQVARGAYFTWAIWAVVPRSSPTHAPSPGAGASKNVLKLPSKALAIVLPALLYEPGVPITVPLSSTGPVDGVAETSPDLLLSPAVFTALTW